VSTKLPVVSGPDLIRALQKMGYIVRRQKGSHVHLVRAADKRRVTVPVHGNMAIAKGTLRAILKDAEISIGDLRDLL